MTLTYLMSFIAISAQGPCDHRAVLYFRRCFYRYTHLLLQGPVHDWPSSSESLLSIDSNLTVSQGFVFILLIAIVVGQIFSSDFARPRFKTFDDLNSMASANKSVKPLLRKYEPMKLASIACLTVSWNSYHPIIVLSKYFKSLSP